MATISSTMPHYMLHTHINRRIIDQSSLVAASFIENLIIRRAGAVSNTGSEHCYPRDTWAFVV